MHITQNGDAGSGLSVECISAVFRSNKAGEIPLTMPPKTKQPGEFKNLPLAALVMK